MDWNQHPPARQTRRVTRVEALEHPAHPLLVRTDVRRRIPTNDSHEFSFADNHGRGGTPPPIPRNRDINTPGESATTGKALVRAVARVGEDSPAKCGSAQESGASEV